MKSDIEESGMVNIDMLCYLWKDAENRLLEFHGGFMLVNHHGAMFEFDFLCEIAKTLRGMSNER